MSKQAFMRGLLFDLFMKIHPKAGKIYDQLWNPINYAIIGGIGIIINYVVNLLLMSMVGFLLSNIIAILTAWLWNWQNSVGSLGYLWGFKEKQKKKEKES